MSPPMPRARPTLLVTDSDVTAPGTVVRIPRLPHCQRVVLEVFLVQRLVLHVSRLLGRDIDASVFRRLDTKVDSPADAVGWVA